MEFIEEFGMLPNEMIISGNSGLAMAGHSFNTSDGGFFHVIFTNKFDPGPVQSRMIEGGILGLHEVFLAVVTKILLIPSLVSAIFKNIFPSFSQKVLTI